MTWWLEDADVMQKAIEEQRGRYLEDVGQDKVIHHAEEESTLPVSEPRGSVSVPEILQRLGVETAKQDQAAANRVARCLKVAGWKSKTHVELSLEIQFAGPASRMHLAEDSSTNEGRHAFA